LLFLGCIACGANNAMMDESGNGTVCQTTASYRVLFEAVWSAATHPTDFPGGAHFSGLIGATHSADLTIWENGGQASDGMEQMAETGATTLLSAEVQSFQDDGTAENLLAGGGVNPSPGSVMLDFEITADFPLVTLVSMIAPSPDWFVGVSGLELCVDGQWLDNLEVELFAYDAGTDSGATFTATNDDTNPKEPIVRIDGDPFLLNGEVEPLGSFQFSQL
jgi:hypothetical protein